MFGGLPKKLVNTEEYPTVPGVRIGNAHAPTFTLTPGDYVLI